MCMQMVLSGKVQCCKQIVTLSSDEGRVIECDKTSYPTVKLIGAILDTV